MANNTGPFSRRNFLGLSGAFVVALAACDSGGSSNDSGAGSGSAKVDFPKSALTVTSPWEAGGGTDQIAQAFKNVLEKHVDVPVRYVAMPGGGGTIGSKHVADAPADGTQLLLTSNGSEIPTKLSDTGYTWDQFTPLGLFLNDAVVFATKKDGKYKDFGELLAYAKDHPGAVSYASTGVGSQPHIAMTLLEQKTGVKLNHVPFDGGASALLATQGGHVDMSGGGSGSVAPQIQEGIVRGLAVTTKDRWPAIPDVPTIGETVDGYEFAGWRGVFVRSDTKPEILSVLDTLFSDVVHDQAFIDAHKKLTGVDPTYISATDAAKQIDQSNQDLASTLEVIKQQMGSK